MTYSFYDTLEYLKTRFCPMPSALEGLGICMFNLLLNTKLIRHIVCNKRRWISIKIILPELNFLTCRSSRKTFSFYYFQAGNEIFRLCLDKNMFQLSSSDIEDDRFNLDILNECHSLLQIQRSSIWLNNVHLSRIIKMSRWILEYEDTLPYVTNIVCTLWDDRRVELELLNSWFTMKLSVTMSPNVF